MKAQKKVTLIFPPVPIVEETKKEALVSGLKLKAYNLWLSLIKWKFGFETDLYKVLPSKANPISLGLLSLASYLKERDIKVNYIHCDYWLNKQGLSWEELLELIVQETKSSDVCGLYSNTPMFNNTLQIAQAIKSSSPETVIVLGGPHVTFVDVETIEQYPEIDFVVRGEGEETFYEIIVNSDRLAELKTEEVKGATYQSDGVVWRAPGRPLLDAKEIPSPDFSILHKDYDTLLIDMYSRGCSYLCKFCAEHEIWKNIVRFRSPKKVAEELAMIKRDFNQDIIHLADSEIDAYPSRLKELLDAIEEQKVDCRYTVNLRPDAYKRIDSVTLNRMINLGFIGFFVGVESGSDYMISQMGRKSVYSDFIKTIDLLNLANAPIIIPYLMLGFPGETEETIKETQDKFIELLEEERISFLFPKIFIPYPGTDPFKKPEVYSIKLSKDWKEYSRFGFPPPFTAPLLSNEVLSVSIINFYEKIYDVFERKHAYYKELTVNK